MEKSINIKHENSEFINAIKKIAIPIVIQNLLFFALNFVDTLMVGSIGKYEFSGVGLGGQYYFVVQLTFVGITAASQIYMSQYFGSKNIKMYRSSVGLAMLGTLATSILFAVPAIICPEGLLSLFSKDQSLIVMGSKYLRIAAFQYPLLAMILPLATGSRASKNAKLPMKISAVSLALNTILNYILIFGKFGMPKLGVAGAAIATVSASAISLLQYFIYIKKEAGPLNGPISDFLSIPAELIKKVISTGWTVILHEISWSVGVTIYVLIFSRSSTDGYAAYQIAMQFIKITLILTMGISSAASVTIGAQLGANQIEKAIRFEKKFTNSLLLCAAGSIIIVSFASYFAVNLFNVSQDIRTTAFYIVLIICAFIPFRFYTGMHAAGILRAGGDTKIPPLIEVGGVYLFNIPFLYLAINILSLSYPTAVLLGNIGDLFVCLLIYKRTKSLKWAKNLINY